MITALTVSQIVLWLLVIGLSIMVLALAKQIGVLHERIAPVGALSLDKGPKVGTRAPMFELPDVRGGTLVKIGGQQTKSTLLMFVSPTCPVCKKVLPIAKTIAQRESGHTPMQLVLVSDGKRDEHLKFISKYGLEQHGYLSSPDIGMTYQIGKLPYAVFIDPTGMIRAKGLVNSREHLESLLEAHELGVASVQEYLASRNAPPANPEFLSN